MRRGTVARRTPRPKGKERRLDDDLRDGVFVIVTFVQLFFGNPLKAAIG